MTTIETDYLHPIEERLGTIEQILDRRADDGTEYRGKERRDDDPDKRPARAPRS
jgi:hypothetical protein